ncbi:2-oxoadipate dioxygenase/decarboxylase family protein [Halomonas sp. WWR20]
MDRQTFFEQLWNDYVAMTPQAQHIHDAFVSEGETIVNDHVAFRTFDRGPITLESLEPHLLALGYTRFAPYDFKEKKLRAYGYLPPEADQPRVFLSELKCDELSASARAIIDNLVAQVDPQRMMKADVLWAGRLWDAPSYEDYQALMAESEYAAWLSIIGLRTNHFTISVNHFQTYDSIEKVLAKVESLGLGINESGGRVKGSPEVMLEQGSTLADRQPFTFADGQVKEIATCYYEFAKRYRDQNGELYQGFVAASADKIFESTYDQGSADSGAAR